MANRDRINVVLPPKVKEIAERSARRRGLSASALLCMFTVERLLADGDITEADLALDESEDVHMDVDEPVKAERPTRAAP